MRITLKQLQVFDAIAFTGTTAKAARAIGLSQSATSAALKEIENALDTQLFDRVGRKLLLNENGRLLLPQARQMLDSAKTIEAQFRSHGSTISSLTVGASTTIGIYILPRLLSNAGENSLPQVIVANTADIAASVVRFEADVGLIEGPCHENDLITEPWLEDELIVVTSPQHPLAQHHQQHPVSLKQLSQAKWLLREKGSGTQETVEQLLLPHLHQVRPAAELSNSEAIKQAAIANLGVTCLSRSIVTSALETQELVELNTELPYLSRRFYIVYHHNKTLSPKLKYFLSLCRAVN